ncbi:MAG: CHASE2 domain-containing protein [Bacteroidia bacterium]|nr:CHASE2 domain-containing protein [Bacteroidia bacterium]MDW8347107.1 CHASE2 domain-containing protein [Bacteroidia bacterium]
MSEETPKKNIYFNVDNILITLLVFIRLAIIVVLPFAIKALNPIGEALKDFNLTDLVFSQLRDESKVPTNTNIVIVDVGDARECDRGCIATEIMAINRYKPKVLALDMFFRQEKKQNAELIAKDSLLEAALNQSKNLVMATQMIYNEETGAFTELRQSHPRFIKNAIPAFVNVITDEGKKKKGQISKRTVRTYTIKERIIDTLYTFDTLKISSKQEFINYEKLIKEKKLHPYTVLDSHFILKPKISKIIDSIHYSFPYHIVRLYDKTKAEKALARKKKRDIINYYGNVSIGQLKFQYIPREELLSVYETVTYYEQKIKAGIKLDENEQADYNNALEGAKNHERIIKDKIVLMGIVPLIDISDPKSLADVTYEDTYYTPLNPNYVGRSYPDMYGLMIHANVIAMMLDENYINQSPLWLTVIIAIVSTFLSVLLFTYLFNNHETVYRLARKTIQFIMGISMLFILVFVFHWFNYFLRLELTAACILLSTSSMRMYYRTVKPIMEKIGIFKSKPKQEENSTQVDTKQNEQPVTNSTENPST